MCRQLLPDYWQRDKRLIILYLHNACNKFQIPEEHFAYCKREREGTETLKS